jgi:hypothetical protein
MELRQGGPLAVPGNYEVKLTAGGKTVTTALRVDPDPRVHAAAVDLEQQLIEQVEGDLIQLKSTTSEASLVYPIMLDAKLAMLENIVESADTAPTQQARDGYIELGRRLADSIAKWLGIEEGELKQFNEILKKANLAPVAPK